MNNVIFVLKTILNMKVPLYKRYNFILMLLERFLLKKVRLYSKPYLFIIEPTTYCNLRCPKCVHSDKNASFNNGTLTYENFTIILEEIKKYAMKISFAVWGEPFLNKEIFRMIKSCKENHISTEVATNLNFADPEIAKEIVRSGLDTLNVALDGTSQESYEKYRIGGNIKRVFDNINLIQKYKKTFGGNHPKIMCSFLVNRYNEHEIEEAKALASNLGVDIGFYKLRPSTYKEVFMSDEEKYQDLLEWFPQTSKVSYQGILKSGKPRGCSHPWTISVINFDGGVYPCCSLTEEKYYFGNLLSGKFDEIWNNELFINARRIILGRQEQDYKGRNLVCNICKENNFTLPF